MSLCTHTNTASFKVLIQLLVGKEGKEKTRKDIEEESGNDKKGGRRRKEGSSQNAQNSEDRKNKHFLAALIMVPWGSKPDVVRATTESSVSKKKMGQGLEAGSKESSSPFSTQMKTNIQGVSWLSVKVYTCE